MVTINTQFDPRDLPGWAQRNRAVVEMCRSNLAFRCDVCAAETQQIKTMLRKQAEAVIEVMSEIDDIDHDWSLCDECAQENADYNAR